MRTGRAGARHPSRLPCSARYRHAAAAATSTPLSNSRSPPRRCSSMRAALSSDRLAIELAAPLDRSRSGRSRPHYRVEAEPARSQRGERPNRRANLAAGSSLLRAAEHARRSAAAVDATSRRRFLAAEGFSPPIRVERVCGAVDRKTRRRPSRLLPRAGGRPVTRASAVSTGVEDYYLGGPEATGTLGRRGRCGARAEGTVSETQLERVLSGEHPRRLACRSVACFRGGCPAST